MHESILCQIKYFRTALEGRSKEASTKLIMMPEEEPLFIACLLEFLYTGSYKDPLVDDEQWDLVRGYQQSLSIQALLDKYHYKTFTEGLYHARVLAVAEKYECEQLRCYAAEGILGVLFGGSDADWLELQIELYKMSGPGSTLRLNPDNIQKPDNWKNVIRWHRIMRLLSDPITRHMIEDALERCPDLGQDLEEIKGRLEVTAAPIPIDEQRLPLPSQVLKLMREGSKHGRYPGWPTVPAYMAQ